jgi:hypothetical protein
LVSNPDYDHDSAEEQLVELTRPMFPHEIVAFEAGLTAKQIAAAAKAAAALAKKNTIACNSEDTLSVPHMMFLKHLLR